MIHKKRKKNASFGFDSHIQGRFRPFPAVFRPISAVSAVSATGRYDSIWPIRPDFGRISPIRRESKPIRHESSRIGANRAESARIREKKKKIADAVRRAGNRIRRCVPRRAASDAGAAPLVLHPCFLADESLGCTVKVWLFYLKRENSLILLLLLFRLHILSPLLVLSFLFSSLFLYFLKEFFKSEKCKNSHSLNEKNGWI